MDRAIPTSPTMAACPPQAMRSVENLRFSWWR